MERLALAVPTSRRAPVACLLARAEPPIPVGGSATSMLTSSRMKMSMFFGTQEMERCGTDHEGDRLLKTHLFLLLL
ncbi:MAG TPA: hypothetical protein VIY29_23980 [Ktedonobacteraceae bacterium]